MIPSSQQTSAAHAWTPDEALTLLESGAGGLGDVEARSRLVQFGPSALVGEREVRLDDTGRGHLLERKHALAARGLRVLALARRRLRQERVEESALDSLTFVGLIGMIDPLAVGVKETIRAFRDAGIRTVMITDRGRPSVSANGRPRGQTEIDVTNDDGSPG